MSDLISREALMNCIRDEIENQCKDCTDINCCDCYEEWILSAPTAYDIDEKVEQPERNRTMKITMELPDETKCLTVQWIYEDNDGQHIDFRVLDTAYIEKLRKEQEDD